jgi:hypothetical protein
MQVERDVHESIANGVGPTQSVSNDQSNVAHPEVDADGDLGDNVELF